jgi:hypothetical protein
MKRRGTLFMLLVAAVTLISSIAWIPISTPPGSGSNRIRFAYGATSAAVVGDLNAYSSASYILWAAQGQLMDVTLSAPEGVSLKVSSVFGWELTPIGSTSSSTSFRGYLPYSGDYILKVYSGSQRVSYSLNVFIPVRVSFDPGATSDRQYGYLNTQQGLDYILRAQAGQVLEVNATPDRAEAPLQLVIYGVDGSVLRSGMGEGSSFRGELPTSGDYIVQVRAGEVAMGFTLDVIIPQRIRFSSGAVSASMPGWLPAYHTQYYALRAMKGQTMEVEVIPEDNLQLIIYGMDGTVLRSGMGEGASFRGELPSTQDYILAVRAAAEPAYYRLNVTIR